MSRSFHHLGIILLGTIAGVLRRFLDSTCSGDHTPRVLLGLEVGLLHRLDLLLVLLLGFGLGTSGALTWLQAEGSQI